MSMKYSCSDVCRSCRRRLSNRRHDNTPLSWRFIKDLRRVSNSYTAQEIIIFSAVKQLFKTKGDKTIPIVPEDLSKTIGKHPIPCILVISQYRSLLSFLRARWSSKTNRREDNPIVVDGDCCHGWMAFKASVLLAVIVGDLVSGRDGGEQETLVVEVPVGRHVEPHVGDSNDVLAEGKPTECCNGEQYTMVREVATAIL